MIQMSATRAAGPSLDMLRIREKGMSKRSWRPIKAAVDNGLVVVGVTASKKDEKFSAVKMMQAQTNPICEIVIDERIKDLILGPPISSPISP